MSDSEVDLLTVAEAAARLGVSERRLRHILQRGEYAATMRTMTRRTRSGIRHSAGIPPETLAALAQEINQDALPAFENNAAANAANNAAPAGNNAAQAGGEEAAPAGKSPETIRQEIRQEIEAEQSQKERARLEEENGFLRQQLAHAVAGWRDEQRRVKDMEQRMKELTGPPEGETLEAPPEAPGGTETGAMAQDGAEAIGTAKSPAEESAAEEKPAAGWWARLWGGKD